MQGRLGGWVGVQSQPVKLIVGEECRRRGIRAEH